MVAVPTGRFAPSPTGDLHLGNLRTAVLAWLWSRHDGDDFLVRMEDLDRVTSSRQHERSQLHDLAAIGLDWDGEVVRQSDRFGFYDEAIAELDRQGLVYPCYCTRREIAEASSAPNGPPSGVYPGTCRELSTSKRRELEAGGRQPALRLRAEPAPVTFADAVLGEVTGTPDDVVLRRNDGVPAYHLAVVVDDHLQHIGLVVRADDLAPSTPSQIHLQRRLGFVTPRYAHVPLVLSPSGHRLAKRDGSVTLSDRLTLGDDVADVARWLLATSGQPADVATGTGATAVPAGLMAEAIAAFDPTRLPRTPVVVSEQLLGQSLRSLG